MGRRFVLGSTLGVIVVLMLLTITVMIHNGLDILVVISLVILALLGFGVLGALENPPDE